MCKKLNFFRYIFFGLFFLNFDVNSKIASDNNLFLKRSIEGLNNSESEIDLTKAKSFIRSLSFYDLSCDGISSLKLERVFKNIDNLQTQFDDQYDFDLIKKGIAQELAFDHLVVLRQTLISFLGETTTLISYWNSQINKDDFWEKTKSLFAFDSNKRVNKKIKDLVLLRDRVAAFLGKIDEISLPFFKEIDSAANDNDSTDESLKRVEELVDHSIFCVSNFFSDQIDPDNFADYQQKFKEFSELDYKSKTNFLCKNHMNILLAKESLKGEIKNYRIPCFARRHWFLLSVLGITGIAAGGLAYYKREYLFKGAFTDDVEKFYKDFVVKWVFEPFKDLFKKLKHKFVPESSNSDRDVTVEAEELKKSVQDLLDQMNLDQMSFDARANEHIKKLLAADRLPEKPIRAELWPENVEYKGSIQQLLDALEMLQNKHIGDGSAKALDNLKAFLDNFNNNYKELCSILEKAVKEAKDNDKLSSTTTANFLLGKDSAIEMVGLIEGIKEQFGSDGAIYKLLDVRTKKDSTSSSLSESSDDDVSLDEGIDLSSSSVQANLMGKGPKSPNSMMSPLTTEVDLLASDIEALVFMVISSVLKLIYTGVSSAFGRLDSVIDDVYVMKRNVQVTLNWISIVFPVFITSIVIPTISFLIAKKMYNDRMQYRTNKITTIIANVYRVLVSYKSYSCDYYSSDLSYKDRGLINFWVRMLEESDQRITRDNKDRLRRLISDLQNPAVSVAQLISLIKLEWGSNLFGPTYYAAI